MYSGNQVNTACQGGEGNHLCPKPMLDQDDYGI